MNELPWIAPHALHAMVVIALVAQVGQSSAVLVGFGRDTARRWPAACLFSAGWLTALFHVLAAFKAFDHVSATLALAAVAGFLYYLTRRRRLDRPSFSELTRHDIRRVVRMTAVLLRSRRAVIFGLLALLAFVTVSRVAQAPPLAWDALTYHAVKPALWLQSGGDLLLDAPGGWSTHRGRLAGAEIIATWAVLAGPGDAFWGLTDIAWWLALAIGLQSLARELGLRARERGATMAFGCFVPAVFMSVGGGYVELPLTATISLTLGLLLSARRTRHGGAWLAGVVGAALLAGMKLTTWPGVAVLMGLAATTWVGHRPFLELRRKPALLWGGAAWVLIALPAPLRQFLQTGYPLSVPLHAGPFALGPANVELSYLETLASALDHGFWAEVIALSWSFGSPLRPDPQLTITGAVVIVLALVGAACGLRGAPDKRAQICWLLLTSAALLATWFAPPLETVRLHWAQSNARHLLPMLVPLLPLALLAGDRGRPRARLTADFMLLAAAAHGVLGVTWGWPPGFATRAVLGAAVASAVASVVLRLAGTATGDLRRRRDATVRSTASLLVGSFVVASCVLAARTSDARWSWYEAGASIGSPPRYWVPAARHLGELDSPVRIALTGGPHPPADGWFIHPLLGPALEHRILYLPVTDSPLPRPLAPGYGRREHARFARWRRRLDEQHVDYVMAFWPTQLELGWMRARPGQFERVDGDDLSWGLYRLRRP